MNGTIDLSDHGNAASIHDQRDSDEIGGLEGWDESWSDSWSSCSCSSCSTCSLCDFCSYEDFDVNTSSTNNTAESAIDSVQGNTSALKFSEEKTRNYRKRDGFADSLTNMNSYLRSDKKSKPSNITCNGSGLTMYSSGSDKETSSSSSTNSSITRSVDSELSSNEHCIAPEKKYAKKKVTFLESSQSGDSVGFSLENGTTENNRRRGKTCSAPPPLSRTQPRVGWNKNLDLEYKRLESVFAHIDPFKLHSIVKHQLRKKNAQTISALAKLFPKGKFSGETVHCVRCHDEYSRDFGQMDCYLQHPKNALTKIHQKGNTAYYRCACCKKEYWVRVQGDDDINIGHCFVGTHTSRPDDVFYAPLGAAQSCEDKGCIEFYV